MKPDQQRCPSRGRGLGPPARRTAAVVLALVLLSSEGAAAAPDAGQAQPADAPLLLIASVRRATAELDDGRVVEIDGGVWLSTELAVTRAQDLERLAAENWALRQQPPPPPAGPLAIAIAVVAALAYLGGLATPRP